MSGELKPEGRIATLVVEDHPFFREGVAAWLDRQVDLYCCGTADTVPEALARLAETQAPLVLLDLQLHGDDGFAFMREARKLSPKSRIIVLSYKDQTIFAERVLKAGALGYVLKDEASTTMRTAIRTVLRGGVHLSPEMYRRIFGQRDTRATSNPDSFEALSHRELQVLELLGRGSTTKEIAHDLQISPKTVDFYRDGLKKKLGCRDGLTLVRVATVWQQTGEWRSAPAESDRFRAPDASA